MRRRCFLSDQSSVEPADITVSIGFIIENNTGNVITGVSSTAVLNFNGDEVQLGGSDVPKMFPIGYNFSKMYTYTKTSATESITLEGFEFIAAGSGAGEKCVATTFIGGEQVAYTDSYLGPSATNYSQVFTSMVTIKPGDTVDMIVVLTLN